jgi:hypothetical protein
MMPPAAPRGPGVLGLGLSLGRPARAARRAARESSMIKISHLTAHQFQVAAALLAPGWAIAHMMIAGKLPYTTEGKRSVGIAILAMPMDRRA